MRNISKFLLASAASISLVACGEQAAELEEVAVEEPAEPTDIVGVAQNKSDFSTLVVAMTTAELGETLSGEGPFTVFAPTNDAFNKVDPAELSDLLSPEKKDDLAALLSYHVISGKMTAADVTQAIADGNGTATLTTVQGAKLKASLEGQKVILEDATGNRSTVTLADVDATNGVIHAIDTVVMPG
ncbi:fasciclin domain-containing protein [Parasphingorhabdus litoris]|uniref:Fasciclin domain-containing protein n=1 Tax=Parasphingorhabdus litoris TaxID=394733 RepID=A0ABP3K9F3_9SPHN|nr:fasciclin domain-containing protein [Parasphingorhabdus litoris]